MMVSLFPRKLFWQNRPEGFTLLEVLVALVLLGITVTVVIQLFSANLGLIARSEDYVDALVKAESKMREIVEEGGLEEGTSTEITPEGFTMDVRITETLVERTELLPVKVFEIDLTVRWKKARNERSIKLKTLKTLDREV
jgi:general secretion pathway protein I